MSFPQSILIQDFLKRKASITLIDARSPVEFNHAHIPGAINFPLLSDEERTKVGTCYKRSGHDAAVDLGFELVGPKFSEIVKSARATFKNPDNELLMYCLRGGLRSRILSFLFSTAGFKVTLLKGGYKSYRTFVQDTLNTEKKILVLGGYTGSGKTDFLKLLKENGEQILDLEDLANHRGSSFGSIGLNPQPTYEQFENLLAEKWDQINPEKVCWLEDESRMIGKLKIPDPFYLRMREATLLFMKTSKEKRIKNILGEYGKMPKELLLESTVRLEKRLGNKLMNEARAHLENNELEEWLSIILWYYDKSYDFGLNKRPREKCIHFSFEGSDYFSELMHLKHRVFGSDVRSRSTF